jgi:hypothetical protein
MSYNVPVRHLQGGSVLEVAAHGTLLVSSGGSIQFSGAGALSNIAFGSVVLTDGGSATVGVGFPIRGFTGVIVGNDGSISGVAEDRSLYAAGSVIIYGKSGTLAAHVQRGTVGYVIFG